MTDVTISVITATYNASEHLPRLIESLAAQSDQDFEWVVADGASTDGTLELLEKAKGRLKRVIIDSRPDFGIYDALNRAIKLSSGEYYLVMGADDELFPEAIAQYKKAAAESGADMVTAMVEVNNVIVRPRGPAWEWLYGAMAHVSSHAVGLLCKKEMHRLHGYYTRRYPITADQIFIMQALRGGATLRVVEFVAGRYDKGGFSGSDILGTLTEFHRTQIEVSGQLVLQAILFVARLIKNRNRILGQLKIKRSQLQR